ncbi:MAG: hypothetical protein ACOX4I_01080 [Anaerovoracaceae bacterium]
MFLSVFTAMNGVPRANAEEKAPEVWDGTSLDISWYDPEKTEFEISTPAQLEGLAAIVNGIYNKDITNITGNKEYLSGTFVTGSGSPYWYGKDDFKGKTIKLTADLDMGGKKDSTTGTWSGPNFMPIGGQYCMDVDDTANTLLSASFNGTLDGNGHYVKNIYCERYSGGSSDYKSSQSIALVGRLGCHDSDPVEMRADSPTVKNVAVSGYIHGRRSIGGIVGKIGKTNNGALIENCANYCDVSNTDSKGVGGIVGASWNGGKVSNCYNAGAISSTYSNPTGGIVGSNEIDIENCYNVGTIKAPAGYAMAIGTENGGSFTVTNCYWLQGSAADGGFFSRTKEYATVELTEAEMKADTMPAMLGDAYAADTDNINNGYPILKWQVSESGDDNAEALAAEKYAAGRMTTATARSTGIKTIKVSWKKLTGVSGYKVYRATSSKGRYKLVKTAAAGTAAWSNSGLKTGKNYYFKVMPFTSVNGKTVNGKYSKAVKAMPRPVAPRVTVKRKGRKAKVTWKKVRGASGYVVYRAKGAHKYKRVFTRKKSGGYTYVTKRLKKGTYKFKVRAYKKVGSKRVYGYASKVKKIRIR